MSVKLLTEHHLEFLSLKGGCTGLSESTLFKMPHCWKSHVAAQLLISLNPILTFVMMLVSPPNWHYLIVYHQLTQTVRGFL